MARNRYMVALVFAIFFVMSLSTNILGPLVPDIINSFGVSLSAAALLPFSFFIAYGVISIPAGFLVERFTEKPVMLAAFFVSTFASLGFALHPTYRIAVASLFLMGAGMATLQVAINPLLRVAGGEEHFAFNSAFAQLIFGSASFVSPLIYSYLVVNLANPAVQRNLILRFLQKITPTGLPWASMYSVCSVVLLVMTVILWFTRMPQVQRSEDEQVGTVKMYLEVLRNPVVWLFFGCVFAYVGSEQGTADWISQFLFTYHGMDSHTTGAAVVSWFWGLLTAGCFIGMLLLKVYDSRRVLIGFSLAALLALSAALFGPARVALIAFPLVGLFASIMWPVLVSLGLNSVSTLHGPFAGILCSGIMGGAVVPVIIGRLGDHFGLRAGMMVLYLTFSCVLSVGFWAQPIISNATIRRAKEAATNLASSGEPLTRSQ